MATNERDSFRLDVDAIRALAQVLDYRLGIRARKMIMAGHENLTLHTSASVWSNCVTSISNRLGRVVGYGGIEAIFNQAGLVMPTNCESE